MRHIMVTAVIVLAVLLGARPALPAAGAQTTFATPEEAVEALAAASKAGDLPGLDALLGPDAQKVLTSGDPVEDAHAREDFVEAWNASHRLEKEGDAKVVLIAGTDEWPFPIPLVQTDGRWRFDTKTGEEEILDRRIGRNELATIQVCLAIVDAQREYAAKDRRGTGFLEYAPKFVSTAGQHDGLYWETAEGEAPSPLGPLVADARAEGYRKGSSGEPTPYHGYLYKTLSGQGSHARDGAYDYTVKGHQIGGFALLAYPAKWGSSGVMSFLVNQDGIVYEKDLGKDTGKVALAMKRFDPDDTWVQVDTTGSPATAEGGSAATPLVGKSWLAEDIDGAGVVDGAQSTLLFETEARAAGSTGCNRWFSSVELTGTTVQFGAAGSTRRACVPAVMDQESRFLAALLAARTWKLDSGKLLLIDEAGKTRMRLSPHEDESTAEE